jgi:hypothetical protein
MGSEDITMNTFYYKLFPKVDRNACENYTLLWPLISFKAEHETRRG